MAAREDHLAGRASVALPAAGDRERGAPEAGRAPQGAGAGVARPAQERQSQQPSAAVVGSLSSAAQEPASTKRQAGRGTAWSPRKHIDAVAHPSYGDRASGGAVRALPPR